MGFTVEGFRVWDLRFRSRVVHFWTQHIVVANTPDRKYSLKLEGFRDKTKLAGAECHA